MMLTPVAEAKSASDQSRDSRSSRIAAPAVSRLTTALRAYSDTTQPQWPSSVYTFLSRFPCQTRAGMYTLLHTFQLAVTQREVRTNGASMLGQPGVVVRLYRRRRRRRRRQGARLRTVGD